MRPMGYAAVAVALVSALSAGELTAPEGRAVVGDPALDSALEAARVETGAPGASAAVLERGQLVWAGASGSTLASGGEPVTPQTLFITASAGKSVAAATALRLVDQGRLRLGQSVAGPLPGLRGGGRITLRDLLEHAGGLPDYLGSPAINRTFAREPFHRWRRGEVLRAIGRPRFDPGSRSVYSNSNYVALGGVVEGRTGVGFERAFRRLVARPLGLHATSWRYDGSAISRFAHPHIARPGRAPLDPWADGRITTDYWGEVWTDGGLATTATELARVAAAMVSGSLLRRGTRKRMLRFREGGTGLGVFRERLAGRTWVGHDGLYGGFSAQHWTDPRRKLTLAVLANLETLPGRPDASWAIFRRLAEASLAGAG